MECTRRVISPSWVIGQPVGDVLDAVPVGAAGRRQLPGQLLAGQVGAAADVVELTGHARAQDQFDAGEVVLTWSQLRTCRPRSRRATCSPRSRRVTKPDYPSRAAKRRAKR
ncbi:hypothetical protein GCM10010260_82400 [Streptomyces filipinensis]|uniref:Uncharacterized protein n=1 Tax=Streptomyces filipinensis TaxID=66887 RepID=A0A918ILL6_9ACTN|nr:hypothetical protein GCM10010260_82400 [Streptomyces filipinensis]